MSYYHLNLQLFAEGTQGVTGSAAGSQMGVDGQAAAADTTPDLGAEFDELVKGKYKAQYDAKVKDTVQKRLKGTKETVDRYNALAPTLDLLSSKYGVDANDIDALTKAITEDDTYYEDEALERGMTVQQLKELKKIERDNADMRRQLGEQQARQRIEAMYQNWMSQAEEAKAMYPDFDLQTEMQNQRFTDLLQSNIDVKTAYEVIHKDDIMQAGMQYASNRAQKQVADSVRANGARPAENGISNAAGTRYKADVSKLSWADHDEINKRVLRGEKITFG